MERLKEAILLSRLKRGDQTAFAETYDLFAPRLYRHVLYRTSAPEVAEDIMSETFLRAWQVVRERAEEIRSLKAFLYRIAGNLVIDHYRRQARAPTALTEEMEKTLVHDARIPETADLSLGRDRLAAALGRLRAETRALLVMRYIDDLPIEEIARQVGKERNAVYVALHRAVKELQRRCAGSSSDN